MPNELEYRYYVECSCCGYKKYCRIEGKNYYCRAYDADPENDRKWRKRPASTGDFWTAPVITTKTRKKRF